MTAHNLLSAACVVLWLSVGCSALQQDDAEVRDRWHLSSFSGEAPV